MTTDQIINAETGEIEIVTLSKDELAKRQEEAKFVQSQREAAEQAALDLAALKSSAKAKLIAGEPLTAAEAETLVG